MHRTSDATGPRGAEPLSTPSMERKHVDTVIEDMRVEGWPGVFVLGCVDRRVTVYSQQVRAFNLAAALFARGQVKPADTVVVVGAGAAGLTCAAGLRHLGANVKVLEKQEILQIFRGGSSRWLHPGVYDWPMEGWSRSRAGLPLLDWENGQVDAVRGELESAWQAIEASDRMEVFREAGNVKLSELVDGERTVTWWGPGNPRARTSTVVLAVGFGLEPMGSYWDGDDFDARRVDGVQRRWLVSGCGDGALTDLLRVCIEGFRHDEMLRDFTEHHSMRGIIEEVRRIEKDPVIQSKPVKLHEAYANLHAPWVIAALQKRRCKDTEVLLNAPAEFLTSGASALNRFLVAQLSHADMFRLWPGRLSAPADPSERDTVARFEDGSVEPFDRIVRRHGPKSALMEGFKPIAEALEGERKRRQHDKPILSDQTRERYWSLGLFGDKEVREAELERYCKTIERQHSHLNLAGFETRVRFPVALDDLHVPLRAGVRRRDDASELEREGHEIALADALAVAGQAHMRGVVLLGHPGSGKTTHLKQVLLKVVREGSKSVGLPEGMVPVFVPLRRLRELDLGLRAFVEQHLDAPGFDVAPGFGARMWERGNLLLLLDGLDEVANAKDRQKVAGWIREACEAEGDNRFVVTCRFAGYTDDAKLGERFLALELRPMGEGQVETFVRKWYATVEGATGGDVQRADQRATELLETLQRPEMGAARVYSMTHNPLLLTTICLVHRDRGELPRERVLLYEEAVAVLLEWWRRVFKDLDVTFPSREARLVLQPVAGWMHENKQADLQATAAELEEIVGQGLALIKRTEFSALEFLQTIRDESGLLTGVGVDEFGFMHLGFQEYLAARSLRARAFDEPEVLAWLAEQFEESWWQEVILLLLADGDPPMFRRFMGEVVKRPELVKWAGSAMMDRCWNEAFGVTETPFVELLERADAGDATLSERQDAAAELLARKLPKALEGLGSWGVARGPSQQTRVVAGVELVLVPGGRFLMGSPPDEKERRDNEGPQHDVVLEDFWLAKTPVTNAQYGEYLKANPRADKPALWGDDRYNQAEQPVVGVSWEDAHAYCKWAGLLLPTEAQWEYACRGGEPTRFWSGDSDKDLARVGWYDDNSEGRLHAVAEKDANPFGLYDMHGNVSEWCEDTWVSSYKDAMHRQGDGLRVQPVGDGARVIRGGIFDYGARYARSAYRFRFGPGFRSVGVGFRAAQGHPLPS